MNRPFNVSISYNTHPCGGIITDQSGYLQSPKIGPSSKSVECVWLIKVTEGERINLTTIDLHLGQDCDKNFLSIYNGPSPSFPRIQKYCGENNPQNSLISEKNEMWVEYSWSPGSTGKEIKLKYEPYGGGKDIIFTVFLSDFRIRICGLSTEGGNSFIRVGISKRIQVLF